MWTNISPTDATLEKRESARESYLKTELRGEFRGDYRCFRQPREVRRGVSAKKNKNSSCESP